MRYLLVLLPLLGCSTTAPAPAPPDSTIVEEGVSCAAVDQHLTTTCPRLAKTPAGKDFTTFCKETGAAGVSLNLKCLVKAKTCEEADACPSGGAK